MTVRSEAVPDLHYTSPRLAALYDRVNEWSEEADHYLALADGAPLSVLDIGCGTGRLCERYATRGHRVTGVDPSAAMLDVARGRSNGGAVHWVHSRAEDFASSDRFDLVVMTGHAFQVFLTDEAVARVFDVMGEHLAPGGRVVFESRNPAIDWMGRWNRERDVDTSEGAVREIMRTVDRRADRLRFTTTYRFADEDIVSDSELRFLTEREIRARVSAAGLTVSRLSGDWRDGAFDPDVSEEMIFTLRHPSS